MQHSCWMPSEQTGFLMCPDPVGDLDQVDTGLPREAAEELQATADDLPKLVADNRIRSVLKKLAVHDMSHLADCNDGRIVERLFQIYSHFANAYVWCDENNPADHIPAGVAVPLHSLAKLVDRPPILPYASTSLCNFERIDKQGALVADNLRCIQKLIDIPDESWFHLIHVEIECHAGKALQGCITATSAVEQDDESGLLQALETIPSAFDKMIETFKRMGQGCSPDIYYFTLRPYLFGFDDVVYEGVEEFGGKPQSFRGESGAQSTVIPALKKYLGLQHERGGLTEHMEIMTHYMPKPHRELLSNIAPDHIRDFVVRSGSQTLKDAYNACLESMVEFRSLHLNMANSYVARKVKNPKGTGGTDFMHWLKQLRDETAQQFV